MANDLGTWYAASSTTKFVQMMPQGCLRVDLDLFYGKIKFGPVFFCIGKS